MSIDSKYCDYVYRLENGDELPLKVEQVTVGDGVSFTNYIMPDNRVVQQIVHKENSLPGIYQQKKNSEYLSVKNLEDGSLIARYKHGSGKPVKEIQVKNGAVNGAIIEYGFDGKPRSITQMKDDKKHGRSISKNIYDDNSVSYFWEGKLTTQLVWATKQNYEDITNGNFKPVVERILGTSPIKKLQIGS